MRTKIREHFYKSLFDNMVDGWAYCQMIFDKQDNPVDFVYLEVNKNFTKFIGVKNILGKKISDIIPGVRISNPELFIKYGKVALTGKPESFDIYIKQLSKWFSIFAYSPRKNFFVGIFKDITEKKQVEKDLNDARIAARNVLEDLENEKSKIEIAQAKEAAILQSIGDGLIATDKKGNIILINKVAEKLFGLTSKQVAGRFFADVFSMEDEKGELVLLEKRPMSVALETTTTTTTITENNYSYVCKDKTKFPAAIIVTPVVLDGETIGVIEVFRNITQEKQVDKAKTEFISLASHQLRTPLTVVNWYAEMLLSGCAETLNEKQKKYVTALYSGNQHMVKLVNALLNISRFELGNMAIELKPTSIVELVQAEIEEQKTQINAKRIKLYYTYEKKIPLIEIDPNLMHMAVQNILSNAVKFTPKNGTITVSISLLAVKGRKSNILIQVSDTGYGIPKQQQSKIFTKFFRADNVRSKDAEGTGLGLYFTKSIIEYSGGKIWFESEENKGTTFYVMLPIVVKKK